MQPNPSLDAKLGDLLRPVEPIAGISEEDLALLRPRLTPGMTYTSAALAEALALIVQARTGALTAPTLSSKIFGGAMRALGGVRHSRDNGRVRVWTFEALLPPAATAAVTTPLAALPAPPTPPTVPSREDWAQAGRGVAALAEPEPMSEEGCPNAAVGGCDRPASEHDEMGRCPEPERSTEGPWSTEVLYDDPCPKADAYRLFGCRHPAWLHGSDGTGPCQYHAGQPDGCGCGEDD